MAQKLAPRDQGAPDHRKLLHPGMARNYGKWDYHERIRPGVLRYVAQSGESLYVVRAGSPRTMSPEVVEKICSIADRFCQGFLRFSMRTNVEFMVEKAEEVEPLIEAIKSELGFPIGGTGPSISNISHTQGWLHCNLPGTDAAGTVKALMDDLIEEFENERFPNRVKITTSCCQINCGRHADIGVIVQHHHPPRINHNNMQICDLPKVVAICPTAAIRPRVVNGFSNRKRFGRMATKSILIMNTMNSAKLVRSFILTMAIWNMNIPHGFLEIMAKSKPLLTREILMIVPAIMV